MKTTKNQNTSSLQKKIQELDIFLLNYLRLKEMQFNWTLTFNEFSHYAGDVTSNFISNAFKDQ